MFVQFIAMRPLSTTFGYVETFSYSGPATFLDKPPVGRLPIHSAHFFHY